VFGEDDVRDFGGEGRMQLGLALDPGPAGGKAASLELGHDPFDIVGMVVGDEDPKGSCHSSSV
jgi:hypothetical protein